MVRNGLCPSTDSSIFGEPSDVSQDTPPSRYQLFQSVGFRKHRFPWNSLDNNHKDAFQKAISVSAIKMTYCKQDVDKESIVIARKNQSLEYVFLHICYVAVISKWGFHSQPSKKVPSYGTTIESKPMECHPALILPPNLGYPDISY